MALSKQAGELRHLGSSIRRIRTSLGITQEKLAELADINPRSVRRIEAGEMNVLITTVGRIRKALGCTWNELMPGEWKQ